MKTKTHLLIITVILLMAIVSCQAPQSPQKQYPSHNYHYTDVDTAAMQVFGRVYVPVYSDIYHTDGTRRFSLTTTLSIRNVGIADTMYVYSIGYFDSHGKLLRNYTERPLILLPLESVEFVVENKENEGGAGANFIVEWTAEHKVHQPLIQSVMIGTEERQGISFCTNGIAVDYLEKK